MNAKYSAYDQYKDSGEAWLGAIPSSWTVIKIGHLSPVGRGASPRPIDDAKYFDDEGEYAWTRIADVTASDVYLRTSPQRLSSLGSSLSVKLEPGELFLSIAATVGKPCITAIKACIHDGFVYFPELRIPNKFLFYVFAAGQAYKGLGKMGTQLNLNTETVARIKVGIGSIEEIMGIVEFLDHETAKIDVLIEKQQQLLALLREGREALLHVAISEKGTESVRLEHCWERVSRPISRRDDEVYYPIGLLNRGRGIFHKDTTPGRDLGDSTFFFVEDGDLIFSGQFAWEGAVALAGEDENGCVATHRYPIVRGREGVAETAFLWAFFASQTGDFLLNESSRGGSRTKQAAKHE